MKPYMITGPESLLKAAYAEIRKSDVSKFIPSSHEQPFECLYLYAHGYWLDACVINGNEAKLTLPADWDKLMGILAELKKPKPPEHVRSTVRGQVAKVHRDAGFEYEAWNVSGQLVSIPKSISTPITEQEFIEGGLKELAEAGYVKGARVQVRENDGSAVYDYGITDIFYTAEDDARHSGKSRATMRCCGFVFAVKSNSVTHPVGQCTLIPALPTTSAGIPYMLKDGNAVVYGKSGDLISLQCNTIKHLLRQGVTGLVTRAGHLGLTDLELLTK